MLRGASCEQIIGESMNDHGVRATIISASFTGDAHAGFSVLTH